ncbi:kielin/chordin-like protein [Ostrea edulis]|uniref:kielin/chordin-like protein n=1 Tax=Ostrea edulis TaxID=37623 RepID=UPI0024AFBCF9|nr:kielin/chordin-like protein [Ostrea edulis]
MTPMLGILFLCIVATTIAGNNCYWNGQEYDDGDMILHKDTSPCKEFKCVNGVVELTHYMCPACPVGRKAIQLSWECCPRCFNRK